MRADILDPRAVATAHAYAESGQYATAYRQLLVAIEESSADLADTPEYGDGDGWAILSLAGAQRRVPLRYEVGIDREGGAEVNVTPAPAGTPIILAVQADTAWLAARGLTPAGVLCAIARACAREAADTAPTITERGEVRRDE